MAGGVGVFSIREYAAAKRASEPEKSWPFGSSGGGGLPPMVVRRFRWWGDELPPPAEPARRQRTPKKRSVSELFAALPPVAVDDGCEGEKRKKKAKAATAADGAAFNLAAVPVSKKDKHEKTKSSTKPSTHQPLEEQRVGKQCKPTEKVLAANKRKGKIIKKLKKPRGGIFRNHDAENFPLHSMIRNWRRHSLVKKAKRKNKLLRANILEICHEAVKHVNFSGVDALENQKNKLCTVPQLQSLRELFSDVLSASSAVRNCSDGQKLPSGSDESQLVTVVAESSTVRNFSNGEELASVSDESQVVTVVDASSAVRSFSDSEKLPSVSDESQVVTVVAESSTVRTFSNCEELASVSDESQVVTVVDASSSVWNFSDGEKPASVLDQSQVVTATDNDIRTSSLDMNIGSQVVNEQLNDSVVQSKTDLFATIDLNSSVVDDDDDLNAPSTHQPSASNCFDSQSKPSNSVKGFGEVKKLIDCENMDSSELVSSACFLETASYAQEPQNQSLMSLDAQTFEKSQLNCPPNSLTPASNSFCSDSSGQMMNAVLADSFSAGQGEQYAGHDMFGLPLNCNGGFINRREDFLAENAAKNGMTYHADNENVSVTPYPLSGMHVSTRVDQSAKGCQTANGHIVRLMGKELKILGYDHRSETSNKDERQGLDTIPFSPTVDSSANSFREESRKKFASQRDYESGNMMSFNGAGSSNFWKGSYPVKELNHYKAPLLGQRMVNGSSHCNSDVLVGRPLHEIECCGTPGASYPECIYQLRFWNRQHHTLSGRVSNVSDQNSAECMQSKKEKLRTMHDLASTILPEAYGQTAKNYPVLPKFASQGILSRPGANAFALYGVYNPTSALGPLRKSALRAYTTRPPASIPKSAHLSSMFLNGGRRNEVRLGEKIIGGSETLKNWSWERQPKVVSCHAQRNNFPNSESRTSEVEPVIIDLTEESSGKEATDQYATLGSSYIDHGRISKQLNSRPVSSLRPSVPHIGSKTSPGSQSRPPTAYTFLK